MKILFDEDAPRPLRKYLTGHEIVTVQEMGWAGVKNGELLLLAESHGFDVLLTFDRNLRFQQNLAARQICILVVIVPNKRLETIIPLVSTILSTLTILQPGEIHEIEQPI